MDPMRFLASRDPFEQTLMIEIAMRALKLREDLARQQANLIAEALRGR